MVDYLLVTALHEERDAMLAQYSTIDRVHRPGDPYTYFRFSAKKNDGTLLDCCLLCLTGMGRVAAANAANTAIRTWQPHAILLVGIAGGRAAAGVSLGDVLVADQVVDYELQKLRPSGPSRRFAAYPPDASLLSLAQSLRPGELRALWPAARPEDGAPRVHYGPVACGDKVIAHAAHLEALCVHWPKLIGVEMESTGVAAAVWGAVPSPRFLMVRSVSDLADADKNNQSVSKWRDYACNAAAVFAAKVLFEAPVPRDADAQPGVPGSEGPSTQQSVTDARRRRSGPLLAAGDMLADGRFSLVKKLGSGGFSTVWQASDSKTGQAVALKVLHQQWAEDRTKVERFTRGARKMSELWHTHIVETDGRVHHLDGCVFFSMEWVDGPNLRDYILSSHATSAEVSEIVNQLAEALDHAHENGLVHRDVKPQNVIVGTDNCVKVIDFDLVRAKDTTGGTRTGAIGTFLFAAPEALESGKDADRRADIYSLAMTALFCLYGSDLPVQALKDPDYVLNSLSLPVAGNNLFRRALDWDPTMRPATAGEFASELAQLVGKQRGPESEDPPSWATQFNASCRKQHAAAYAAARGSERWPTVVAAVDSVATSMLATLLMALQSSAALSPNRNPGISGLKNLARELLSDYEFTQEENATAIWLSARRGLVGLCSATRELHQGKRELVEAVIVCVTELLPREARTPGFLSRGDHRKHATSLRPGLTQIGLTPSQLSRKPADNESLARAERRWIAMPERQLSVGVPHWWRRGTSRVD